MTGPTETLRLRVRGLDDHVDRAPEDVSPTEGPTPTVRALAANAEDRMLGRERYEVTIDGWVFEVSAEPAARADLRERATRDHDRAHPSGVQVVKAQIPGRVVRLWVSEGDTVETGQRLLAIEAMKMENEVRATRAGIIESIRVAVDGKAELGDELLTVR